VDLLDLIIVVLLGLAVARGMRSGLAQLFLSSAGFVGGLLLGSWAARHVAIQGASPSTKLIVILGIELGAALILSLVGERAGMAISARAARLHLIRLNQVLGAGLEVVFMLLVVWLAASGFANTNSYKIGYEIRHSLVIRELDAWLPAPPNIFAQLEKVISPNGFPNVFVGLEPQHTTIAPNNSVNNQAIVNDEASVVKIQGDGCGGIIDGSGFVVDKGIVVTNAHVVAGVPAPEVVDGYRAYHAVPIWFDPNMDIAILRVNNLPDPPLTLSGQDLASHGAAAILGFPGGGPLTATQAVVIDQVIAKGQNIYNRGTVSRSIYELQAVVQPGNSGGPLLAPDGSVAGIVFAKSVSQDNVGYALLINPVKAAIHSAESRNQRVSTSSCAE
jgi:S1-C subfamily serine protease